MKWSALAGSAVLAAAAAASVLGLGALRPITAAAGAEPAPSGLTAVEFARRLHAAEERARRQLESDPTVGEARVAVVPTPAGQPLKVIVHVTWSEEAAPERLSVAARTVLAAFDGVAEVTAEATDDSGRRAIP